MHVKIYFNDKPLFLADQLDAEIEPYVHHDDAVMIDELSAPSVNAMIHEMRQPSIHAGIFIHKDLEALKHAFFKKFKIVKAAGGIVTNSHKELLLIFRRGKWDLPKGKMDEGETIEECTVREIAEETGITTAKIKKPLLITYHTYDENGKHILKESHWYLLTCSDCKNLTPQTEEQISDIRWVKPTDLKSYMSNTFPSVIDVMKSAGYEWR
jgi:8-oxo-dGTP pyrophosphatase MutT (NUDIX family)